MYAFLRFPGFKRKALTLSYDDDTIHDKRFVELIDKYGLKCTFNLNSGLMGVGRRMPKEDVLSLFENSHHEIALHGERHMGFLDVPKEMIVKDVVNDKKSLEEMFNRIIPGMAYAYGDYNDTAVDILDKAGVVYSRTCFQTERFDIPTDWLRWHPTIHHAHTEKLFALADKFLDDTPARHMWADEPRLFYVFGHSYEFNDADNWDMWEEFLQKVSGKDNVWYATNLEIYEYVKAFDSLRFSYDGNIIKNPTATDVYTNFFGKEILIKAGETVNIK